MENICKNCGKTITLFDKYCPFCNSLISEQKEIENDYIITPNLNEKFKDEKLDIKFNLRSIVNELDYKKDFENDAIELTDEKDQYLECNVTDDNFKKIKYNIDYYIKDLNDFKKDGKHHLETAGAEDLQELIAKFNDVINTCNKYKKFVNRKDLIIKLDKIINDYDTEVNYVKKYFVLPLYEADRLLAQSRIIKNFINMLTLFICYFSFSHIQFFQEIFNFIRILFQGAGKPITDAMFYSDINAFAAFVASLGLTEIIFAYYISFTIKNRNFKVDKHKNYEPIKYFVPVIFIVSLYAPILTYISNVIFLIYLAWLSIQSFRQKRFTPLWLGLKIATIVIAFLLLINVITVLFI